MKRLFNLASKSNNAFVKKILRKVATKNHLTMYLINNLKSQDARIGYYCNTVESKILFENAIKKDILKQDDLIIVKNNDLKSDYFKNSSFFQGFSFKNIDVVFCCTMGPHDGSDIDGLWNAAIKENANMLIDTIACTEKPSLKYRFHNLSYHLDEESAVPSHFNLDNYINELKSIAKSFERNISIIDMCAGQGCIGFSVMNESNNITSLLSVEINPNQITLMKNSIKSNKLPEDKIDILQSDGLELVPKHLKFDLVCCNPPHYDMSGGKKDMKKIRTADKGWQFHRKFLKEVTDYLKPNGIFTILENSKGSTIETFKPMIAKDLEIINVKEVKHTPFYIIIAKKV